MSAEAGERAGDDAGDEEHRQVIADGGGAHDCHSHGQLPQVVRHGGEDADHPHLFRREPSAEQSADTEGQQAAGHAEQEGHHLSRGDTAQSHPHQHDAHGGARPQGIHGKDGDHVGQPQLDAGDGGEGGQLRFRREDAQGDGGEQGGQGQLSRVHDTAPVTASTLSFLLSRYWMSTRLGRQTMGDAFSLSLPRWTHTLSGQEALVISISSWVI